MAAQPSADAAIDELPIFSLAVTVAGGCLWLDHLPPGRNPGQDYARLMEAICHALELPADRPEVTLFGFPMAQAPQLGRDINAARDALLGFLERRLEKVSPRAVILLGDLEQPWFNRECLSSRQVISTVSAWRMLRDPGLKATAWSDLKVLLGNAS